jgi:hypothetical protein
MVRDVLQLAEPLPSMSNDPFYTFVVPFHGFDFVVAAKD